MAPDLELALAHVVEVLRRPQDGVDEHAGEGEHQRRGDATAISTGSAMRRRASANVQKTSEPQQTIMRTSSIRITSRLSGRVKSNRLEQVVVLSRRHRRETGAVSTPVVSPLGGEPASFSSSILTTGSCRQGIRRRKKTRMTRATTRHHAHHREQLRLPSAPCYSASAAWTSSGASSSSSDNDPETSTAPAGPATVRAPARGPRTAASGSRRDAARHDPRGHSAASSARATPPAWRPPPAGRARVRRARRRRPCPRGSRHADHGGDRPPRPAAPRPEPWRHAGCAPRRRARRLAANRLEPARHHHLRRRRDRPRAVERLAEEHLAARRSRPPRRGAGRRRAGDGGRIRLAQARRGRPEAARRSRPRSISASTQPATRSAPGASTASFSAAIASRVPPSCSTWSRPTLVSATTGASSTLVASYRPPSPASTATASAPALARATNAAAVSTSNCVIGSSATASTPAAATSTRATAAASRRRRAAPAQLDALGEPVHVRRDVRTGGQAVRLQDRGGEHASSRSCRWCRRRGWHGTTAAARPAPSQRPHAVEPEPHSDAARVARRSSARPPIRQLGQARVELDLAAEPVATSRSSATTAAAPGDEPGVGELRLPRREIGAGLRDAALDLAAQRDRERAAAHEHASVAHRGDAAGRGPDDRRPPQAGEQVVRRAQVGGVRAAAEAARRAARGRRPGACAAARCRARSRPTRRAPPRDPRHRPAPGTTMHQQPALPGQVRPDLLGHERHDRMQQRQHALEHVQRRSTRGALVVAVEAA